MKSIYVVNLDSKWYISVVISRSCGAKRGGLHGQESSRTSRSREVVGARMDVTATRLVWHGVVGFVGEGAESPFTHNVCIRVFICYLYSYM